MRGLSRDKAEVKFYGNGVKIKQFWTPTPSISMIDA